MVDQPTPAPVIRHAYSTGSYHVSQKYMNSLHKRYDEWTSYKKQNTHRPGDLTTVSYIATVAVQPASTGTRRAYQTAYYVSPTSKHAFLY